MYLLVMTSCCSHTCWVIDISQSKDGAICSPPLLLQDSLNPIGALARSPKWVFLRLPPVAAHQHNHQLPKCGECTSSFVPYLPYNMRQPPLSLFRTLSDSFIRNPRDNLQSMAIDRPYSDQTARAAHPTSNSTKGIAQY